MLSFKEGRKICKILSEDGDEKFVYLQDDIDGDKQPEIKTTKENEAKLFNQLLSEDKKLSQAEIDKLKKAYISDFQLEENKLQRKFSDLKAKMKNILNKKL